MCRHASGGRVPRAAYLPAMASDRRCFWCGGETVVWGWGRVVHGEDGNFHVLHAMRRACPAHIRDCLDWQAECQHPEDLSE